MATHLHTDGEMGTPLSGQSEASEASCDFTPQAFIDRLDVEAARAIAVDAHRARMPSPPSDMPSPPSDVTCLVVEPPHFGTHNVVYELRFSDGTSWVMRIPFAWSAVALRRNLIGHQFIASHTSLPVPKIHAYSFDSDNALGQPYTILDSVRGTLLADVWNDPTWWTSSRTKSRTLSSLARHMVQLASLEFSQIGLLDVDDVTGIHHIAEFTSDFVLDPAAASAPRGPFDTQREYLSALLNSATGGTIKPNYLVFLMLNEEIADSRYNLGPFSLCHPDLNYHNVFVDDESGEISALIDWDDLSSRPLQVGALAYPEWLMADWDPTMYQDLKQVGPFDSVEDLHLYRTVYLDAVRAFGGDICADVTRNSHVMSALITALTFPPSRVGIMLQLGKLVFGSASIVARILTGMHASIWRNGREGQVVQMPGTSRMSTYPQLTSCVVKSL